MIFRIFVLVFVFVGIAIARKTEKAREHLNFVIQNASQISEEQEAKEHLTKMS